MDIRTTPLNKVHRDFGGRMVAFAGWELPVQYKSALEEHHAVREKVGVFDVSHMGQIELLGPDAVKLAQKVTCNDVSRLAVGQAQYSALLTPMGTFVDDIVVYNFGPQRIFICVNAATCAKDFAWIGEQREGEVDVVNRSDSYAQIAVQGPRAEEVVQRLTSVDLSQIKFYWFTEGGVAGADAIISRTGYTGESGFELYVSPDAAETVWLKLFEVGEPFGITPAGLAARNTLRLEMKYPLYGNDIDDTHTPLEAGLGWIVKLQKDFIGKSRLAEQKASGTDLKLVGFEMKDSGIVRDGYTAIINGREVGKVTSGGFSPSLGKSIGLAYVPASASQPGQELEIDIRGKIRKAEVVETPFLKKK